MRMRATMLSQLGLMPSLYGNNLRKVFSQKYHGDVTIAPRFTYMQSIGISAITQPNKDEMIQYLLGGKRAVYPHANRIRHMLLLETTLSDCVHLTRTERRKFILQHSLDDASTIDGGSALSDDEGVFHPGLKAASMPSIQGFPPKLGRAGSHSTGVLATLSGGPAPGPAPGVVEATHYRQLEWEYRRLQTRFERLRSENLDLRRRLEDIRSMCASDPPGTAQT